MHARKVIFLKWRGCWSNRKKRKRSLTYYQHFFCVLLISSVLIASLMLVAGGQAAAIYEEIQTKIEVQSEFPQIDENVAFAKSITPQMFGAVGDGERDDTEAFLALASYCNENPGTSVEIPAGHYIISKPLSFTEDVTIHGNGSTTLLDFTRATENSCAALQITGSFRELEAITSPQSAGNNCLIYQNTAELSKGDLIAILDPSDYSWCKRRDYYRKGEFCEVSSLTDKGIELADYLCDDYRSGCNLLLMNMVQCGVCGFDIQVPDGDGLVGMTPLRIRCARNSVVRDISAKGGNHAQIEVRSCYNILVDHIVADYISTENIGLNYGLLVSNSQFVQINNSILNAKRHGIAIGGGADAAYIINRFIKVSNSTINSTDSTAADIHCVSQHVLYDTCTILNGIDIGGSDIEITNCDIYSGRAATWVYSRTLINGNLTMTENQFHALNGKPNGALFSIELMDDAYQNDDSLIFLANNTFDCAGGLCLTAKSPDCVNTCTLLLKNNFFSGGEIRVENFFRTLFDGNVFQSRCLLSDNKDPIYSSVESIIFTNNILYNTENYGVTIKIPNSVPLINVARNTFNGIRGTAIVVEKSGVVDPVIDYNSYLMCQEECSIK